MLAQDEYYKIQTILDCCQSVFWQKILFLDSSRDLLLHLTEIDGTKP